MGIYAALALTELSGRLLADLVENTLDLNDGLHCTLIYSERDPATEVETSYRIIRTTVKLVELWESPGGGQSIVATLADQLGELDKLHAKYVAAGAVHSYPDYRPHVTLASGERLAELVGARSKVALLNEVLRGMPLYFANEFQKQLDKEAA